MHNIIKEYLTQGHLPSGDDTACEVDDSKELFSLDRGGSATFPSAALMGGAIAGGIILFVIVFGLLVRQCVPRQTWSKA